MSICHHCAPILPPAGEIFAGWVHSHPFRFCKDCPLPAPAECIAKVLFYSQDDEFLMELSFASS